jgi:hypothetical protein
MSSNYLYQYIKDNFFLIIQELNIFNNLKKFLIEESLLIFYNTIYSNNFNKNNNDIDNNFLKKNSTTIKFLSRSISLIMIMNLQIYKDDLIIFILNFAEKSNNNVYFSLLILRNYLDELERILHLQKNDNLLDKTSLHFTEKIPIIVNFITHAINIFHFNNIKNQEINNYNVKTNDINPFIDIVEIALDFILSWKILNLQFLKNPYFNTNTNTNSNSSPFNTNTTSNLFEMLLKLFPNPKYCEKISFIICDQIIRFDSSLFHVNNLNQTMESLLKKFWENIEEINIIKSIILFFEEFLTKEISLDLINESFNINLISNENSYPKKYNYEEYVELGSSITNIISVTLENYTILLITKNELNNNLNNILKIILTCKNKRINSRIFPAISQICNLLRDINYENLILEDFNYLTPNFTNEIDLKNYFSNMLIEYMSLIMLQCKLNKIYIPLLDKVNPIENFMEIQLHEKSDEEIILEKYVSTHEYRQRAEDVYYDIFSFFLIVMEEEGAKIIFEFLGKIIEMHNINNSNKINSISEEEKNDKSNNIEVIIHLLNSINDCFFSVCRFDYSIFITDISLKIFKTQIVNNKLVLVSFISLLDKISLVIDNNQELKHFTIEILFLSLCDKKFETVSSNIIRGICEYLHKKDEKLFNSLQLILFENFKNYENNTIYNLIEGLIDSFYFPINRKNGNFINIKESDAELFEKFSLILSPLEFMLKELDLFIENKKNLDQKEFKNLSRKIFFVYFKLLEKTINFKTHSYFILSNFYSNCNKLIDFIFMNLYEDEELLNDILKIYLIIFSQNIQNENLDYNILKILCINLTNLLIELFMNIKNDKNEIILKLLLKIFENVKFLAKKETFELFEIFKKLILFINKDKYISDIDFRDNNLHYYIDIIIIILNSDNEVYSLDNFYIENFDILSNFLFESLFLENNNKLDNKIMHYFGYLIKKINNFVNENYLESLISKLLEKIFMRFELIDTFEKVFI